MRAHLLILLVAVWTGMLFGQSTAPTPQAPKPQKAPGTEEIQTEEVGAPQATPPPVTAAASTVGSMDATQVKALLHKLWLTDFRLKDLLAQVHPERWKMPETAKKSFGQTLENLQKSLAAVEDWRAQFDNRPDSLYLGFETYVAINAVLPRLEGVAQSVALHENPNFGGQYSQAGNQLFDLQQALQPHLAFLLKNQDGLMLAAQTNLAACQSTLGYALKDKNGRATPMRNVAPVFKGTRHAHHPTTSANSAKDGEGKGADPTKPDGATTKK